jgi:hypothetical protein
MEQTLSVFIVSMEVYVFIKTKVNRPQIYHGQFFLVCLGPLAYLLTQTFKLLGFTGLLTMRLFLKDVVRTKLDIYVFIHVTRLIHLLVDYLSPYDIIHPVESVSVTKLNNLKVFESK